MEIMIIMKHLDDNTSGGEFLLILLVFLVIATIFITGMVRTIISVEKFLRWLFKTLFQDKKG